MKCPYCAIKLIVRQPTLGDDTNMKCPYCAIKLDDSVGASASTPALIDAEATTMF